MDRKGKSQDQHSTRGASNLSGQQLVNINEATVEQLEMLTGIGRAKAEAIVEDRKNAGLFTSVTDLTRVNGVGKGVLDQNLGLLVCQCPVPEISSSASSCSNSKRRETRSTHTAAKLNTRRQRKLTRTAPQSVVPTSSPDQVSYRTRSGANNAVAAAQTEKTAGIACASSAAAEPVCEQPSTSAGHLPALDDTKTPNDVRASLEPLFEGCKRQTHSLLSRTDGTQQCSEEAVVAGPSEVHVGDGRSVRSRCVATRSNVINCNNTTSDGIATKTNGDCDQDMVDCERFVDNTSSGHSSAESCSSYGEQCCMSPKKFTVRDNSEKNGMKRKAEDQDHNSESKKSNFAGDGCSTHCNEPNDGPHGCVTDSSACVARKQRIPSRRNPPAMMSAWIQTFQEWSHAERLIALDTLVESCSPTQVRHIMQVIEPQFQRDFISFLPKELALYVLSFLEPRDLIRASQTCRYWRTLAEDNLLWREKCQEEGLSEAFVFGNRLNRRQQNRRCGGVTDRNGVTQWKSVYKRQRQIENNWSHGSLRPPKVLKGHDDHVITCLEFNGSKIVSGSDDNTLKVWSAITGKCLRTLVGHTGGVWSSQMSGNIVISGSTDRTLKVWNVDTGQCVYTLYGHTSTVRCMHLHGNRLVSGSRDATLRVWDIDTGHCLRVLIGHVAAVRCVQFDGRRVVSGAYDYMVKIWDPETETCLQTLAGHTNRVYSLQFDGIHIVSGSLDTSIRVWNAETGACLHTLIGHQSLTSGMELRDNILVSGNADSTVKVWNIATGQCLQTLQGPNKHQSAVTCLQFNRRFVITSSDDGTVKIWDLRSGDFLRNLVALDSGGSGGVVWRIRCSNTTLVGAVGSRNGTEETKLLVLDFDLSDDESNVAVAGD